MAYWVRKDSTFIDCYGNDFEIALLEDDTAGTTSEFAHLELADCFETEYLKTGPPDEPWGLQRLTAYLRVRNEATLLQDIRDADEEKYRLRYRTAGSGTNIYTLKVRTRDIDRELYHGPLQEIVATDGIDQLQSTEWDGTSATRVSAAALIRQALGAVGWGIGFRFSSDWYPTSTLAATDDPLNLGSRLDRRVIYNAILEQKGGADRFVSYYDLLLYLSTQFQCLVKLDDNTDSDRWRIYQRLENHDAGGRYYWDYNSAGTLTGQGTETTHTVTFDDTDPQQKGRAIEKSWPALKQVRYVYEHGTLTGDLDPSKGFSIWESGAPKDHTMSGSPTVSHVGLFGDTHAIRIHDVMSGSRDAQTAADQAVKYGRYTTREIAPVSGDQVDFAVTAATFPVDPIPLGRRWYYGAVSILAVGANKWMDADGSWGDDELRIPIPVIIQDGRAELTSKVFSTSAVPTGTTAFQLTYYQLVDSYDSPSKVGGIWYGRFDPVYKTQGNREDDQTVFKTTIDAVQTTETREYVFYLGQGPIANSTPGRLTWTGEADAEDFVRGDGAAGSGIDFARFWNTQYLRQFRAFVLDRERTLMGAVLPGASDVVIEGSLRQDAYYRYRRNWGMGEVTANWVEIRSDSLSVTHEDLRREWDGIDPTDDGADPPDEQEEVFVGGFNGLPCLGIPATSAWALFPHLEPILPFTIPNYNRDYAAEPDGWIVDDATYLTYDEVEGLVSTDTGTTRHGRIPHLVVGSNWVRFTAIGHTVAKSAGAETIFYMKAGTATEYKLTKQADGTLRLAVTSNGAESTVNVDTTIAATAGKSYQWYVGIELSSESPAPATLYLKIRTDTLATESVTGVQTNDCSGEPYEIYELYEGPGAMRLLYLEADTPIRSTTQFVAAANCLQQFANSKGGSLSFGTNHDAYLVTDATNFTVYDLFGNVLGQIAHGATTTHYARPAYDPINGLYVFAGIDGKVYSWAIGDVSVTLEHDFATTIKCRGAVWSNSDQRLYAITEDSGSGDFGHFTNRTGTWAWNSLDTTYAFIDFQINVAADRLFALKSNGDVGLYSIASDGTLTELDTYTPSGTAVAVGYRDGQGFYIQINDGSVIYLVEEEDLSGSVLTTLTSAHVYIQPGLVLQNWGLHGFAVVSISAADHILRFDFDELSQGTSAATVSDRGAVGATCRGIALARVGTEVPSGPENLVVTASGAKEFTLSWDLVGTGETGVRVWQSSDGVNFTVATTLAAGSEDTVLTGYSPGDLRYFKVQAFNATGSSGFSNTDSATTYQNFVLLAVQKTSATAYDRIYLVNPTTKAVINQIDITGNWEPNVVPYGNKQAAYSSYWDRIFYTNAADQLRSVKLNGDDDTLAVTLTSTANPVTALWALSDGAVSLLHYNNSFYKWEVGDVNLDTTWDTATTVSAAGLSQGRHDFYEGGTGDGWMRAILFTDAVSTWEGNVSTPGKLSVPNTADANHTCFWDRSNARVLYSTDSFAIKRIPETGGTITTVISALGAAPRCNIWVRSGTLYYQDYNTAPHIIRSASATDGSGSATFYTHADTDATICSIEFNNL